MRILLVEDSEMLANTLRSGLRRLGHAVDVVGDGTRGLSYARLNPYDLLVLDRMLPGLDGLSLLKSYRNDGRTTPVLFLTAMSDVPERVEGLRAGADDYLIKPFAFEEFVARVEALGKRRRQHGDPCMRFGSLEIDTSARDVRWQGRSLDLPAREYALLTFLAERAGAAVSRIEIEDHLYDESTLPLSNAVASAISSLRSRLERAGVPGVIRTKRGLGYLFEYSRS